MRAITNLIIIIITIITITIISIITIITIITITITVIIIILKVYFKPFMVDSGSLSVESYILKEKAPKKL